MAIDSQFLVRAANGESLARAYQWDEVWVTLGRFQKPEEALVDPGSFRWCHRPTGGGAVLHDRELTLAVAIPVGIGELRGARKIFGLLSGTLASAFNEIGVRCKLHGSSSHHVDSPYCFAGASANELVLADTGRKIAGCAMRLTSKSALLQVSIPREPAQAGEYIVGGKVLEPVDFEIDRLLRAWSSSVGKLFTALQD
jgi:lipoate-protein ligase A